MESLKSTVSDLDTKIISKEGVFSKIFILNEKDKYDLMNLVQYIVLAIVPIIIVLKLLKNYVPDDDEDKGSLELLIEILIQIIFIFVSFVFVHRMINVIPTYSGRDYPEVSMFVIVLPLLFLLFTMHTKLGSKINMVYNRFLEMIGMKQKEVVEEKPTAPSKKIQQHEVANTNMQQAPPPAVMSHPYGGGNGGPNFDSMYLDTKTPLVNANTPGSTSIPELNNNQGMSPPMMEPMAANDFSPMGGSIY
jgi:hypothetical protein